MYQAGINEHAASRCHMYGIVFSLLTDAIQFLFAADHVVVKTGSYYPGAVGVSGLDDSFGAGGFQPTRYLR